MDNERMLFEKGCFLASWNDDIIPEHKETSLDRAQKTRYKDLDTLLSELDGIKEHLQDVRERGWQLDRLIEFHNNGLVSE